MGGVPMGRTMGNAPPPLTPPTGQLLVSYTYLCDWSRQATESGPRTIYELEIGWSPVVSRVLGVFRVASGSRGVQSTRASSSRKWFLMSLG